MGSSAVRVVYVTLTCVKVLGFAESSRSATSCKVTCEIPELVCTGKKNGIAQWCCYRRESILATTPHTHTRSNKTTQPPLMGREH